MLRPFTQQDSWPREENVPEQPTVKELRLSMHEFYRARRSTRGRERNHEMSLYPCMPEKIQMMKAFTPEERSAINGNPEGTTDRSRRPGSATDVGEKDTSKGIVGP